MIMSIYPDKKLKKLIEKKAVEEGRTISNYILYVLKKHLNYKVK